jgi:hypothetical protein
MEKNSEYRFESARDVAFDLEALSSVSASTGAVEAAAMPRKRSWLAPALIAAAVALAAGVFGGYRAGKKAGYVAPPNYQQLTFRRGELYSGRFAPDGQTVIYASAWDGKPVEVFATRTDRPESRVFGLEAADVLAISKTGEMLVSLDRHIEEAFIRSGTLAEVGVSGGVAPREIQKDIQWADWGADGKEIAVVRDLNLRNQLEFPIGKVLYQTAGWISNTRVSADGTLIAFMDHSQRRDDGGTVAVIDRAGKKRTLSGGFSSESGLAWSPNGTEIWITGARVGGNRALWAISLSGGERLLARVTQSLTLQDVAGDGRILVAHDTIRIGVLAGGVGQTRSELAWLDWSSLFDLSTDGKTILFSETGEARGPSTRRHPAPGSAPVRLGDGGGVALSPDGQWAAVQVGHEKRPHPLSTGAGRSVLAIGDLETQGGGVFSRDGTA